MDQAVATRAGRRLTGRAVLAWVVGFFGVVIGVNLVMVHFALSTFGGVETQSSYQAGLTFEREVAAVEAQDELHWQVSAHVAPTRDGSTALDISASDASGRALAGLTATARLLHPTDERSDHAVDVREVAPGRFHGTTTTAIGQWDLLVELSRDGKRMFRSRNRVILH
jgi:nitrogen fixation protein FixH